MLSQKILVIDDDHWLRQLFCSRLRSEGFLVEDASSGRMGYEKAVTFVPDLILSDLEMGVDNGLDILKLLKRNNLTSDIPVIMISANSDRCHQDEAMLHGAVDFLLKPILPHNLVSRIKQRLVQCRN